MALRNRADHDTLLLVFIHGFRGHENHTFLDFPNRLGTVLTNTMHMDVETIVYPTYKTKGDLSLAVRSFCTWLDDIVVNRASYLNRTGNSGRIFIILCGHSMGGILAADAILSYQTHPKSPKIIALIAYDTPFYSVHPDVFSKTAWDRVGTHLYTTTNAISRLMPATGATSVAAKKSGWSWGTAAAVTAVVAAGAAIYTQREKVQEGLGWVTSHLEFVSVLTDTNGLEKRVDDIIKIPNLMFHCFYTKVIPHSSPTRTFITLPPITTAEYFSPITASAPDEVDAHTEMFNPEKNHSYYALSGDTVQFINKVVNRVKATSEAIF